MGTQSSPRAALATTLDIAMWALVLSVVVAVAQGRPSNIPNNGLVTPLGNIGTSGIVPLNGAPTLFSHDLAHDILFFGPSGIITKSGNNIQLTEDLQLATPGRSKRHIIGDSGMLTSWGQAIQFKEPFTTIVLEGPSGLLLSDGQHIQKPNGA